MDGAIRFTGTDARSFLQGQLTNDVRLMTPEQPLLAAHCTAQGRVVALLELTEDADGILAMLPAAMVDLTIQKLRRYLLRAKVTIMDASAQHAASLKTETEVNEERLLEIRAGKPQVYLATTEAFVPQMLNLDRLGAISFNKGCYTGQEIVARAHYRGKVKRRMQRFRSLEPLQLEPGTQARLTDGRGFKVVQAASLPTGHCEFLAVAPLVAEGGSAEDVAVDPHVPLVAAEALPLPYTLLE